MKVQSLRSAITVAGMVGNFRSTALTCGSTPSTVEFFSGCWCRGGSSVANAARTVLCDTPACTCCAIALIGFLAARYYRRTSAQASTVITPSRGRVGGQKSNDVTGSVLARRRQS